MRLWFFFGWWFKSSKEEKCMIICKFEYIWNYIVKYWKFKWSLVLNELMFYSGRVKCFLS